MAKVNGLKHDSIPFEQLLEEEPANAVKSKLDTCAKGTHIVNFDYTSWGWEKHALISYVDTCWYWCSCSVLHGKPVVNQSMNQLANKSLTPTRHFGFSLLFLLAFVPGPLAVQCHDDSASLIYEQGGWTTPSLCMNPWHDNQYQLLPLLNKKRTIYTLPNFQAPKVLTLSGPCLWRWSVPCRRQKWNHQDVRWSWRSCWNGEEHKMWGLCSKLYTV